MIETEDFRIQITTMHFQPVWIQLVNFSSILFIQFRNWLITVSPIVGFLQIVVNAARCD